MGKGWEDRAAQWLAWTRTPGHDAYWRYRDVFFTDIVPRPAGPALEVGCGEGRVARDLAERGHDVTGLDPSPSLIAAAAERHPRGRHPLEAYARSRRPGSSSRRCASRPTRRTRAGRPFRCS